MGKFLKRTLATVVTVLMLLTSVPVSTLFNFTLTVSALDSRVEKAIEWAISIANDNVHGYSQDYRTGPDYDCSSFVSTAFKNGGFDVSGSLGTGTMADSNNKKSFVSAGFTKYNKGDVTLQRGDILLRPKTSSRSGHTELYLGNDMCVAAHYNYDGVSGDTGDGKRAGEEINIRKKSACDFCNDKDYKYVLRYEGSGSEAESNTYTFNFNANGGTLGTQKSFSVKQGESFEISNTTCTCSGYTLAGWNVKRSSDNKWYTEGQGWRSENEINSNGYNKKVYSNNQSCTLNNDWISGTSGDITYTFYAVWNADTYTVSFNANGGSVSSSSKTVTFDLTYGALPVPTRLGYTFAGWYTSAEGGTLVTGGSKVTTASDHTLYARWEGNRVVASFVVGHSGINTNMFQSPCESITVNGIEYSYDADMGILTLNGTTAQPVTQIGTVPFWVNVGDVYAVSGYHISGSISNGELCYDVCGADGNRVSDRRHLAFRNSDSAAIWYFTTKDSTDTERENAAGSGLKLWIDNSNDGKDVVFDNYKIRIKLEKGEKVTDYSPARIVTKVGEVYGDLPTVYRKGYTFAGWYTSAEGGSKITSTTKASEATNQTLYARWEGNKAVTTFDVAHSGINPNMFQSPCESVTVNGIEYSYDADMGILTLNGTTAQPVTQIGTVPFWVNVGDVYAVSGYHISGSISNGELCYDVCGADGNRVSDRRHLAFSNSDSAAIWYFTTKDSTDTERENAAGSSLKLWIDNSNDGKDVVFDNYKIRIKLEKGDKVTDYSPSRLASKTGDTYGGLPTVYRKGYTFAGWYTSVEGGTQVTSTTKVPAETNQTLYAHWVGNKAVTTFDVAHSGINPNMFQSPCESVTVNGIEYSYDADAGILTLNGTTAQPVTQIGTVPFWVNVGDVYAVSGYHISGSISNGELCYDVCGADGNRVSDRRHLAFRNSDSAAIWYFTTKDSTDTERENAVGSSLKLWIDNSNDGKDVVFDNYKIRIKLEKGEEVTDYSPARLVPKTGEIYGDLPTVYRKGYTFAGWYTSPTGGTQITSDTKVAEFANQTLYAHWVGNKVVTTFDVGHSSINPNIFESPCESISVNGIDYSYDSNTGILTLNGTTSQVITQIGTAPFWVNVGDIYTVSSYYVSGSISNGELYYDVCGADGNRVSDRRYLALRNSDSSVTWKFTTKDLTDTERENAAGSSLKLWIDNLNDGKNVVFDNYKVRIKLEKGDKVTAYTPARLVTRVGDAYGKLPTPTRQGYSFGGWYTNVESGTKITETTICTEDLYKTVYAKWNCLHSITEVKNAKSATCASVGYTGDTYCKSCGEKLKSGTLIAKLNHSYSSKVTTAATCTTDGVKTYTCSRCTDSYTESIAATGHKWTATTCTTPKTCSICGVSDGSALGHDYTSKVTKAATCTEEGIKTYTCSRCLDSYTETIDKLAHTPSEAVIENRIESACETKGSYDEVVYCSACKTELSRTAKEIGAIGHKWNAGVINPISTCKTHGTKTYTCQNDASHTRTEQVALDSNNHEGETYLKDKTDATCTENGYTGDTYCLGCNAKLSSGTVIKSEGHKLSNWSKNNDGTHSRGCSKCDFTEAADCSYGEWNTSKESTCTEKGSKSKACTTCGYIVTETIDKLPHTEAEAVIENRVEPKCEVKGSYDEVVYCSACKTELSRTVKEIAATGHKWTAATCNTTKICSTCGASDGSAIGHDYTSKITKAATCTEEGIKTYTCSRCHDSYTETIDKLAHTPSEAVIENRVESACETKGSYDEVVYCSACKTELSRTVKEIAATGHKWTAATCTAPKICSTCGVSDGSALGHDYTSKVTKAATCTEEGIKTYTCSRCHDSYTESISATGHKWTAATCTTPKTCSTCGVSDGSALGHDYTSKVTKAVTCTEEGIKTFTCSRCLDSYTETIDKLAHTPSEAVIENRIESACETKGSYDEVVYCSACKTELSRTVKEIAATGHKWNAGVINPVSTCKTHGTKTYTCQNDASHTRTEQVVLDGDNHEGETYLKDEVDSTCTTDGYTGDRYCSGCDAKLASGEVIPATGHTFTEKIIDSAHLVSAATTQSPAIYKYDCTNCDAISENLTFTYGEKLSSLGKTEKIAAIQNTSAIKITWTPVENATTYKVYQMIDGKWKALGTVSRTDATIGNLSAGSKYSFAVKAGANVDGETIWSDVYTTINTATQAIKPVKVSAAQNTSAIKLSWNTAAGATGYRIYYKSGNTWKVSVSTTSATSHTYNNLKAGAKYTFAIRPYILVDGVVIWSDYVEFTASTTPATVTAKATSSAKGKIALSWNTVNGADGYQIYYKTGDGSFKLYKTVSSSTKSMNFSNLKSGTKYTFAVRAGIKTSGGNIFGGYNTATVTVK